MSEIVFIYTTLKVEKSHSASQVSSKDEICYVAMGHILAT